MHGILTGKLSTVLHLLLNDREGTGPSRTQWGMGGGKSHLALYVNTREKKHTLTCHPGATENIRLLKFTLGRTQLTLWTSSLREKRQHSKSYITYKSCIQHTSHTGIIKAILGYCCLLLLFLQYANSSCDQDISRYVIRIWQAFFGQTLLGKTSLLSTSLWLIGDRND